MADYSNDDRDMSSTGFGLTVTKHETQANVLEICDTVFLCAVFQWYIYLYEK